MTAVAESFRASLDRVRVALEAHNCQPRGRADHLDARCPAHEDRRPSLSVDWRTSPDRGGFTVVNCHTGCDSRDVVSALGLDMRDLFDGDGPRPAAARPAADRRPAPSTRPARAAAPAGRPVRDWPASAGELTATYPYVDAAGALVAEIARFANSAGKSFRVRRPAPERPGWWLTSRPESMPLYRLPEVLAAVAAGRPVYVAEGEKAADALAAAGHAATSKPFGAVKTADDWHPDWRTPLAGARVIVWADRDEPGYRHAAAVAIALEGVAATVAIVRTSIEQDKADAADHFAAGLDFDAVEPVPAELLPAAAGERDNVVKLPRAGRSAQPQWPLPMSQGQWRYSTGDEADGWPRGIYLLQGPRDATEFVRVAPLPYVLERIHRRDGAGRRTGLDYRVSLDAAGTDPVVCDGDEIRGGEWAARLGTALSADDKIVKAAATAIRAEGERVAVDREAVPRWTSAGELELAPADVGPRGYSETSPDEAGAREAWRELGTIAVRNPKVALVLGLTLGGLYIGPLRRQGFALLMYGERGRGKSSTIRAAGAVLGNPQYTAPSWSSSGLGLPALAGELACLPILRDEMSASGLSAKDISTQVIRLAEGAQRTTGQRRGGARMSAEWHSVFVATGNEPILGRTPQEALYSRVIELSTPMTATAADAEALENLAAEHYGWPLAWHMTNGVDLDGFRAELAGAELSLPLASGGTARRLGRHLALGVAGAGRLERVLGIDGLHAAALGAARSALAASLELIREIGMTPADRLLEAVRQAIASRPSAFPTVAAYLAAVTPVSDRDAPRLTRDVEGFLLDAAGDVQNVAILTGAINRIASDGGLDDPGLALRGLKAAGTLTPGGESEGRLSRRQRIGKQTPRVYLLHVPEDPESAEASTPIAPAPTPVSAEPSPAAEPQAPVLQAPAEGPLTEPAECIGCGLMARYQYAGAVWHPICKDAADTAAELDATPTPVIPPAPAPKLPSSDAAPARPAPVRSRTVSPASRQAVAVVAGAQLAQLATPGQATAPLELPAGAVASLAGLLAWAESLGLGVAGPAMRAGEEFRKLADDGQVWLMPDLAAALGLPADKPASDAAATKLRTRLTAELEAAGWKLGKGTGDHWWIYAYRESGRGVRLALPAWAAGPDDCAFLTGLELPADAAQLARRIAAYVEHTGTAWAVSGAVTGLHLVDRTRVNAAGRLTAPAEPPRIATKAGPAMREADLLWQRRPEPDEITLPYVHGFDVSGMYLAAMSSVRLGLGTAEHREAPAFDRNMPGYWKVSPGRWEVRRLPNPFDPRATGNTGDVWLTTPSLALALEQGWWDGRVLEAYVWPAVEGGKLPGVRYLEGVYKQLAPARRELKALPDDADARAVLAAVKGTYTGLVGKFAAGTARGDRTYRPDWQHTVMGAARSNLLRKLAGAAERTGRYPLAVITDHVLYASADPDPGATAAALGLELDSSGIALGKFHHTGTADMTAAAPLLSAGNRPTLELTELIEGGATDGK
jgi:hypothetical protein